MVTGFPPGGAATTAAFLQQPHSVEQALYVLPDKSLNHVTDVGACRFLAKHELREIGPDHWADELWQGVFAAPHDKWRARVMLYFGRRDHWVADEVRDALIAARSTQRPEGSVRMEIDQAGVPHSFCIRHSDLAAEKTAAWIAEIRTSKDEQGGGKLRSIAA